MTDLRLPVGAKGILPTVWTAFVVTVLLALAFSFANVWELTRGLHVERHVAPLIGPSVDITAIALLIVVPWLVLAGAPAARLRPAQRLMTTAGFLTLALNSAPSAINGWVHGDAEAWGRAVVEAIVPTLLIAWSHVGPRLIALFVEIREQRRVAAVEASTDRRAEVERAITEAVAEALRGASVERDRLLAEAGMREAELRASADASMGRLAQVEAELSRLREQAKATRKPAPRTTSVKPRTPVAEPAPRAPRKSAAELLEERVEAAKDALPTWQLETPSGTEIASALGLKSDGIVSDIRKRLDADRLAAAR